MTGKLTLRQHRNLKGLSQKEVADRVGISREHLVHMENDFKVLRSVKTNTVLKIARLYDISLDNILFFED